MPDPDARDDRVPAAEAWDERYREHDHEMSGGPPSEVLVAEITGRTPGRALEVGCGEGVDAIWLTSVGWQVTAIDISRVALERAAAAARDKGVTVDWVCDDFATARLEAAAFDLVSAQYPALRHSPGDGAIQALLAAVAPGGTLLFVHHHPVDPVYAQSHGFDPADYVQPDDVADYVDDDWRIETRETRQRAVVSPRDSPHTHDRVLEMRRIA